MLNALLLAAHASAATVKTDESARRWVATAIERMGGPAALSSLATSTLRLEWVGYRNLLEQSERPEGPWIPQIERTVEIWDARGGRWDETIEATIAEDTYSIRTIVADGAAARRFGETWGPAGKADIVEAQEWMALAPQQLLLDAAAVPDLRREPDTTLQGVHHHVVSFGSGEDRRRIFLNGETGFLTAVEIRRPYPESLYWQVWGDVTTRVQYSYWDIRPGGLGLFYPLQWDVERGGRPWRSLTITKLEPGAAPPAGAFVIPDAAKDEFAERSKHSLEDPAFGNPSRPAVELSPGVVYVPGSWGVALVHQGDGVVVLEAPISAGYSARVLEDAARRFPDVPVKAVVTTSDSWPHIGGIREYAARGIPVYLLDHNVAQIRRALESPHRIHPDALSRAPRKPILRAVSGRTVLGTGPNRIELLPARTETGERMMLAFLPESGLLYASDLFQAGRGGPPEYAWEVAEVARREQLNVRTVFAMHSDPTPWEKLLELVAAGQKPR